MSFVWALPMAPLIWTSRARAHLSRRVRSILSATWLACALPPLTHGWAVLAGTALVVTAAVAADAWADAA